MPESELSRPNATTCSHAAHIPYVTTAPNTVATVFGGISAGVRMAAELRSVIEKKGTRDTVTHAGLAARSDAVLTERTSRRFLILALGFNNTKLCKGVCGKLHVSLSSPQENLVLLPKFILHDRTLVWNHEVLNQIKDGRKKWSCSRF